MDLHPPGSYRPANSSQHQMMRPRAGGEEVKAGNCRVEIGLTGSCEENDGMGEEEG